MQTRTLLTRTSYLSHNVALGFRNTYDPIDGSLHHKARLETFRPHDWPCLPSRDCSYWLDVQFEFDFRQLDISLPQCLFYSDAQGQQEE